jgi:hypothetical protein
VIVTLFALMFFAGFGSYLLPIGQMAFWFANPSL